MNKYISEPYLKQLVETHNEDSHWGSGPSASLLAVCEYIDENKAYYKKFLDYGCGKGDMGFSLKNIVKYTGYDPAVERFKAAPVPSDYVICTDVLEHVEEDKLDHVLKHIASLARRGVLFIVSVKKAVKILPDGRNAHINIKTREEWIMVLSKYFEMQKAARGFSTIRYAGISKTYRVINIHQPSSAWKE